MTERESIKDILKNIPLSYPDFVEGGLDLYDEYPEYAKKLDSFLKNNPTANASDVVRFETEEILGIEPISQGD